VAREAGEAAVDLQPEREPAVSRLARGDDWPAPRGSEQRRELGNAGLAEQVAFWDDVLERISRDPLWKENLAANLWENDYRNSRDTLRYLDALHVELRDVLKELGLARKLD
jgi:hypothetical protein